MRLPRFFQFSNYEVQDVKEFLSKGEIHVHLKPLEDRVRTCHRCGNPLSDVPRGSDRLLVESHTPFYK